MSADPKDLLERATPSQVPELDYHLLARRGRRRRQFHRVGGALVVVMLVTVGAVTAAGVRQPAILEAIGNSPGAGGDLDPLGAWSLVTELDSGRNDAFARVTAEEHLVVYGGSEGIDGMPARDGLAIDLADGTATAIPDPPMALPPNQPASLANERLVVVGTEDSRAEGAYYDLEEQAWTTIPALPTQEFGSVVRYWDGTTLVMGDSLRITEGTGNRPTVTATNPALWLWQVGDEAWTPVPDSPLDPGTMRTAVAEGRLAVWTDPMVDDPAAGLDAAEYDADADEGETRLAVFDLAAGTWTAIPRDELPTLPERGRAHIGWADGELIAVPVPARNPFREGHDDRGQAVELAPPVAYTSPSWRARPLDPLPVDLQRDTLALTGGDGSSGPSSTPITASVGRISAALTDDGTWTDPVTASHIRRVGPRLVAIDTPWVRDTPLTAAVWDGRWRPASDPQANARGFTTVVATDDAIYLVGGSSMRTPDPGEEPDGHPTEDGSSGPYVIDTHRNVIRYTPVP